MTSPTVYPCGWLPYGSDDDSVIYRDPLTSVITSASPWGSVLKVGSGNNPTHDPVLGMKATDSGGAEAGYRLITPAASLAALNNAGQISIDVQKELVCANAAAVLAVSGVICGSEGDALSSNKSVLSTLGEAAHALITCDSENIWGAFSGNTASLNYFTGAASLISAHTIGKGDYVTINLGWWGGLVGGKFIFAVDGVPLFRCDRNKSTFVLATNFYIGSDRGNANSFTKDHYIRNLQISARPPMFPVHPKLSKVVYWGDSLARDLTVTYSSEYLDVATGITIARKLYKHGLGVGELKVKSNGGHYIADSDPNNLAAHRQADVIDEKPTVVFMRAGTNDVGYPLRADFESSLKNHIEVIMGVNGNPTTPTELMILGNIPSRVGGRDAGQWTAAIQADTIAANLIFAGIEAWWDAAYPAKAGRVRVVDTFTYLGGDDPPAETYKGQTEGTWGDIHYGANGHYLQGKQFAEAFIAALGA